MQWWGTALVLLYCVQCAVGFWVQRTPESNRTGLHRMLLAGLGAFIVMLAFYDSWLGFVAADDSLLLWCILFAVSSKGIFRKSPSSRRKWRKIIIILGRFSGGSFAVPCWCCDDTASIWIGARRRKRRLRGFRPPRSERGS